MVLGLPFSWYLERPAHVLYNMILCVYTHDTYIYIYTHRCVHMYIYIHIHVETITIITIINAILVVLTNHKSWGESPCSTKTWTSKVHKIMDLIRKNTGYVGHHFGYFSGPGKSMGHTEPLKYPNIMLLKPPVSQMWAGRLMVGFSWLLGYRCACGPGFCGTGFSCGCAWKRPYAYDPGLLEGYLHNKVLKPRDLHQP